MTRLPPGAPQVSRGVWSRRVGRGAWEQRGSLDKKRTWTLVALVVVAWVGCGPEGVDYARPDHLAPQTSAQREACPGCEVWRCERYVLEAHNADSAHHEQEAFSGYLACLEEVGIEDPCLDQVPQSALFSDRFYPEDWRMYEACLAEYGVSAPQTPQQRCQDLLGRAQSAPNEETRYWFLSHYEACVRGLEIP